MITPRYAVKGGMELRGEDEHPDIVSAVRRREQDRDDYNNEVAGREVGRIQRFLPENARLDQSGKRAERESRIRSALMLLLQSDAAYAAIYEDTVDKLRGAEAATTIALSEATTALDQAKTDLANALDGASTLADGTRVFRDQNGDVWTEDGRQVTGGDLDQITWREGAVSHEEFLTRKKAAGEAQRAVDAILHYQVDVLGHARDQLADEDDPPSKDELEAIQQRIEEEMPPEVKRVAEPPEPRPDSPAEDMSNLKLPPLSG